MIVTEVSSTPFDMKKHEVISLKKDWGPKFCLWPINGHAKRANLILLWHPEEVPGKTNK
jgi:hypothetical protein